MLWFAFILLSLSYWKQRNNGRIYNLISCDLLSFYYLCRTGNNVTRRRTKYRRVVICFHFTIFVVLETTCPSTIKSSSCCDLLSFYYLCRTGNNICVYEHISGEVVICFHFTIFVVLETTTRSWVKPTDRLWFAFILLSLSYWKQLESLCNIIHPRCDLLSFYYLCRTGNNRKNGVSIASTVVICFHFTIFVVLETTELGYIMPPFTLWFAFILLSLSYWKQPEKNEKAKNCVVICFHFTIFVVLETTTAPAFPPTAPLWFAFILLSLSYWKQRFLAKAYRYLCCDLLSFYYLCRTGNNFDAICVLVVLLWFAFILLSLSYWKQHPRRPANVTLSCDLLSFYYLCRTGNNDGKDASSVIPVVICFHFTIFVVLETTFTNVMLYRHVLWFAFILLSLSYWKQLQNGFIARYD